jgi:hypothetical protein
LGDREAHEMLNKIIGLFVALGWVGGSLLFSAFSIAVIIGMAFALRYMFPFLPNIAGALGLLLAFVIYLALVGWIGWKLLMRRLRV